ncbi:small acid-soluble spore protein K [Bacillus sp. JCM 19034]|uniref:small acid-soluble spore protein K n=1 Tax=Bacillus sp. JCM 19034 TaxID=1481928 RepID=UPI0009E91034|nr:small acid-soluble spore protein K [Bacillus sp. JCM 19034]
MRNKEKGFPNPMKFKGSSPKDYNTYDSLRPNGEMNTRPQERMRNSQEQER